MCMPWWVCGVQRIGVAVPVFHLSRVKVSLLFHVYSGVAGPRTSRDAAVCISHLTVGHGGSR